MLINLKKCTSSSFLVKKNTYDIPNLILNITKIAINGDHTN